MVTFSTHRLLTILIRCITSLPSLLSQRKVLLDCGGFLPVESCTCSRPFLCHAGFRPANSFCDKESFWLVSFGSRDPRMCGCVCFLLPISSASIYLPLWRERTTDINEHWNDVNFIASEFRRLVFFSTFAIFSMCTIVTTYLEHPCGATVFSGRAHTDCGQNGCAGSQRHNGQHPGQPCTTACQQSMTQITNNVKTARPCPRGC